MIIFLQVEEQAYEEVRVRVVAEEQAYEEVRVRVVAEEQADLLLTACLQLTYNLQLISHLQPTFAQLILLLTFPTPDSTFASKLTIYPDS